MHRYRMGIAPMGKPLQALKIKAHSSLLDNGADIGRTGIEPVTNWLKASCSTI